jgi:MOSC domain-containing protein YiiM
MMKLLSVNVAEPRTVFHKLRLVRTGIFKTPVKGRVMMRRLNIDGDGQADRKNHGGEYKAVYTYDIQNYAHWKKELGRDDFAHGQFGENLTTEGMAEDQVCIGDIFRIGGAVAEVTQPRNPCFKLGIRVADKMFVRNFLESGLLGIYLRVIEEGEIGAGDAFKRIGAGPEQITVREMARLRNFSDDDLELTRRALRIPALAPEIKELFKIRLEKAGQPAEETE